MRIYEQEDGRFIEMYYNREYEIIIIIEDVIKNT